MKIPSRLKTVAKLCATESTRYAINGVCLERLELNKCRIRATDGRRLFDCTWTDPEPNDPPREKFKVVIPADLWKTALASKEEDVILEEPIGKQLLRFDRGDCAIVGEYDSGAIFPESGDAIPKYKKSEGLTFGMNPILLSELASVIDKANYRDGNAPTFQVVGPDKAMVVKMDTDTLSIVAVIMPCALKDEK